MYIFLLHMAVRMWGWRSSPVTISGYLSPVMHFYFYFYFHLATTAATPLELLHYYTSHFAAILDACSLHLDQWTTLNPVDQAHTIKACNK